MCCISDHAHAYSPELRQSRVGGHGFYRPHADEEDEPAVMVRRWKYKNLIGGQSAA